MAAENNLDVLDAENQEIISNDLPNTEPTVVYEKKVDDLGRAYATGKRKNAVARVWIKHGSGKVTVNEKEFEVFFARPVLRMIVQQPLDATDNRGSFDIYCTVSGGGLSGQAGAIILGISKALISHDLNLKKNLKKDKLTTRDSRVVERKKYGHRKARRSFQFSKR